MTSISQQDYLLAIYRLQEGEGLASTTALARRLDIAPASVTGMVRKLQRKGLVEYQPYRGALLTPAGERQALQMLRRHRLWELFLTQVLELPWDKAHEEAHRLEHATSDRVAEQLAVFLGHPHVDPHGHRIPSSNGTFPLQPRACMLEWEAGQTGTVAAIPDDDPAILRQLAAWGIVPGAQLTVTGWDTARDTVLVEVGNRKWTLGRDVARQIRLG